METCEKTPVRLQESCRPTGSVKNSQPVNMKAEVTWKQRFLRKRLKYMLICVFVVGIIFVVHQLFYYKELNQAIVGKLVVRGSARPPHYSVTTSRSKWHEPLHTKLFRDKEGRTVSLRGIRDEDIKKYLPNLRGKFVCFSTKEEIEFERINDDYCDCPLDGSDEPGTSACNSGIFYCEAYSLKLPGRIPSYKVNDGYCDCCDGSDEWAETPIIHKLVGVKDIAYRNIKCQNKC